MIVKRNFVQNCFSEAIEIFEDKIMKIPVKMELEYATLEEYVEYAKGSAVVQMQMKMGVFKDIEKELVSCMCVLEKNKNPLRQIMGLPYIVTVSMDITQKILKPYNKTECREYLIHGFIHEFTHLFESSIMHSKVELWQECVKKANNNNELANEFFAEEIASLIEIDHKSHDKMQEEIWKPLYNRMLQIQKNRGKSNG